MRVRVGTTILGLVAAIGLPVGCGQSDRFFVQQAMLQIEQEGDVRSRVVDASSKPRDPEMAVRGQRIVKGRGWVFSKRKSRRGIPLLVDQGRFEMLSLGMSSLPDSPRFTIQAAGVSVFYSSGLASLPTAAGCVGYATGGSIEFDRISGHEFALSINLELDTRSPAGWSEDCGDRTFIDQGRYVRKELSQLTPWLGAPTSNLAEATCP